MASDTMASDIMASDSLPTCHICIHIHSRLHILQLANLITTQNIIVKKIIFWSILHAISNFPDVMFAISLTLTSVTELVVSSTLGTLTRGSFATDYLECPGGMAGFQYDNLYFIPEVFTSGTRFAASLQVYILWDTLFSSTFVNEEWIWLCTLAWWRRLSQLPGRSVLGFFALHWWNLVQTAACALAHHMHKEEFHHHFPFSPRQLTPVKTTSQNWINFKRG